MRTSNVALTLALLLCSCLATSGDIDQIGQAQIDSGEAIRDLAYAAQAGTLDLPNALDAIGQHVAAAGHQTQGVASGIERRFSGAATGGLGAGSVAGIAGLITAVGGVALNMYRNRTRETDPRVSNNRRGAAS